MSEPTSEELANLRELVQVAMHGRGAARRPIPLAQARANNLGPIAYKYGINELKAEYAACCVEASRRAHVLEEVVDAFQKAGVWLAPIKGIAFVDVIYADPAERPMTDMDLLVPVHHLADAIRVMHALRFERVGMSRKLSGYYHAIAFNRGGMMVELHRNIVQHHRTRLRLGEIWDRAAPDHQLRGMYRLDPVDELLLCALHIARHELAVPAINYVDVHRAFERLDLAQRQSLEERARDARVSRAILAVLGMTVLLADGRSGRPPIGLASRVLPTTDDVLRAVRPTRSRQLAQKLVLTEGARELAGLTYVFARTYVDGIRRTRG